MSFLHPSYLWALTALAIPIAIHLWSRKEGKTIKIGSIQLLQAYDSNQFSSILLNEKRLLLLRLLVVTLLVFIMAEPQIKWNTENSSITYIVEPSLLKNKTLTSILDTLATGNRDIRLLQTGFPEWVEGQVPEREATVPNYWQLAQEMETLKTDSVVVFTNAFVSGFKGMRPAVHRKMEWVNLSSEHFAHSALSAIQKGDNVHFTTVSSNEERLTFNKEILSLSYNDLEYNNQKDSVRIHSTDSGIFLPLKTEEPVRVLLIYEDSLLPDKIYLEAALGAIAKYLDRSIKTVSLQKASEVELETFTLVIGLQKEFSTASTVKQLLYRPDSLAESLIVPGPEKNIFYITKPISAENSLAEHLGEKLLLLLFPNEELKDKITAADRRVLAKEELLPIYSPERRFAAALGTMPLTKYMWILLLIILCLERFFAFYRKQ